MQAKAVLSLLPILYLSAHAAEPSVIAAPAGSCSAGSIDKAWLDVIFLVDASAGMSSNGLRNAEAFIKTAMRQIPLGGDTYENTRVGVITYSTATKVKVERELNSEDTTSPVSLTYVGGTDSNLLSGVQKAQDQFSQYFSENHHQQVIIILASTFKPGGVNDPTQAIQAFEIDGGKVITIEYKQSSTGSTSLYTLASNNLAFSNDANEVSNLFNSLLQVNCFCADTLFSLSSLNNKYGTPDDGCVEYVDFMSDWDEAEWDCKDKYRTLVKIDGDDKQKAVDAAMQDIVYWIGLKREDGKWQWRDGTEATYTNWGTDEPKEGKDCAYSDTGKWYTAECDGDLTGAADHFYFCDAKPCTAGNNCFAAIASPMTAEKRLLLMYRRALWERAAKLAQNMRRRH